MTKRITPKQIKKTNRQLIYDFIYQNRKVSQQDLAYSLRLSRPTVAANLTDLEEDGLIYKNGQLESDQIGRKAVAYSVVADYRVAIGVELMQEKAKIIVIDLYGREIDHTAFRIQYENEVRYYKRVCDGILKFTRSLGVQEEQVLGAGIAVQGLASADGTTIIYGKILKCTGLKITAFSCHLPYPCSFIHDPDGAALSELWVSPELTDAIYLSLSRNLGAAAIAGRKVVVGKHGHNATFEHISFNPKGELCYCGKRGCLETFCSAKALLGEEDAAAFFREVRRGAPEQKRRWQTYLKHLARAINNIHLVQDVDFVLGGHLAPYLTEADIQFLYKEIQQYIPFEEEFDFIRLSKMPSHNITIGAALPYIRSFLEDTGAKDLEFEQVQ